MREWQIVLLERLAQRIPLLAPLLRVTPVGRIVMIPWLARLVEGGARVALWVFGALALLALLKNVLWLAAVCGLLALVAFGLWRLTRFVRRFVAAQATRAMQQADGFFAQHGVSAGQWRTVAGRGAAYIAQNNPRPSRRARLPLLPRR